MSYGPIISSFSGNTAPDLIKVEISTTTSESPPPAASDVPDAVIHESTDTPRGSTPVSSRGEEPPTRGGISKQTLDNWLIRGAKRKVPSAAMLNDSSPKDSAPSESRKYRATVTPEDRRKHTKPGDESSTDRSRPTNVRPETPGAHCPEGGDHLAQIDMADVDGSESAVSAAFNNTSTRSLADVKSGHGRSSSASDLGHQRKISAEENKSATTDHKASEDIHSRLLDITARVKSSDFPRHAMPEAEQSEKEIALMRKQIEQGKKTLLERQKWNDLTREDTATDIDNTGRSGLNSEPDKQRFLFEKATEKARTIQPQSISKNPKPWYSKSWESISNLTSRGLSWVKRNPWAAATLVSVPIISLGAGALFHAKMWPRNPNMETSVLTTVTKEHISTRPSDSAATANMLADSGFPDTRSDWINAGPFNRMTLDGHHDD